ncbi:autotransporter-associated beta strand repeat protein [Hyphomicrobium denitrificans 1NES1]|uniref:Autotransporter-associated beta strand repeat protein n=1 Tax=Hyphomicrobium denitrificans 1NES1 TaxID=670307 RepID=N0B2R3_9HYPH|nr:autotransporter-associated beta strand repeat protein [Hyphomicrobium denitrificans 1NES1]
MSPSPVEQNRLDSSAPSPERLLIDPGAAAGSTASNPAENSSDPNAPGESYNAILKGSSSNNGTSTGTSGLRATPAPSALSPSMYPQPLTTPPTQNPASNYPAPLTAPHFTQPTMTPGTGIGTPSHGSGIEAHSSMPGHAFSHGPMAGGHVGGSHR